MKFTNTDENGSISVIVKEPAELSLVLERFESFLKACGYCFNGELDIVEKELNEK